MREVKRASTRRSPRARIEFYVIPALFEGLTQYHPELPLPMAALATHYEANAEFHAVPLLSCAATLLPAAYASEQRRSSGEVHTRPPTLSQCGARVVERRPANHSA